MADKRITTTLAKSVLPGERDIWVSDSEVKGFGLRVRPTGTKSFVFRYSLAGKRKFKVLGTFGSVTVEQARKSAKKLAGQVADDRDPVEEKKQQDKEREAAVSISDFCDSYLIDARAGKVRYRFLSCL